MLPGEQLIHSRGQPRTRPAPRDTQLLPQLPLLPLLVLFLLGVVVAQVFVSSLLQRDLLLLVMQLLFLL